MSFGVDKNKYSILYHSLSYKKGPWELGLGGFSEFFLEERLPIFKERKKERVLAWVKAWLKGKFGLLEGKCLLVWRAFGKSL